MDNVSRLDKQGRLRLPRTMLEALGLRPGEAVSLKLVDGELRVKRSTDPYAGYGPVARAIAEAYQQHPDRFLTHEQVMAELNITQAEIDASDV